MAPAAPPRYHQVVLDRVLSTTLLVSLLSTACAGPAPEPVAPRPEEVVVSDDVLVAPAVRAAAVTALVTRHGEGARADIERGVAQVAAAWRESDGDLVEFCQAQYLPDAASRDAVFARLQVVFEQMRGHVRELGRTLTWHADVDTGPELAADAVIASFDPGAHLVDDLFASKIAFVALLNFPLSTVDERARDGARYGRRDWAERRLTGLFDRRVPGDVARRVSAAEVAAEAYVNNYNLWMHHVVDGQGRRLFPAGKRLISHWNLRDELKAAYADRSADGLARQRIIATIMDRIVTQAIPAAVIDDPRVDWDPATGAVALAPAATIEPRGDGSARPGLTTVAATREADVRFGHVLAIAAAERAVDRYAPTAPSASARAFADAELPEARVRALLVELLSSPVAAEVGAELQRRLGRPLEPHDLWFPLARPGQAEAELDALTRARYPRAEAFAADLPRILTGLGFTAERAAYLARHIVVDPSRGAGHAMGAERRGDQAHLRTRVEAGGMDYKGYNIAIHELGHNVEQVFSLYDVDYTLLAGVPGSAFTEALAFLFQARDLELLGQAPAASADADRARVLDAYWNTREIAGSALVELDVWRWLQDHPTASAAELREATVRLARAAWNQYFAPVHGGRDATLLAIYSHTISTPLYLFHYVIGHLVAFQLEAALAGKDRAAFAREFERVSRLGNLTPDRWMTLATGAPVSAAPLLAATRAALAAPR
jgi:hypothetical protein